MLLSLNSLGQHLGQQNIILCTGRESVSYPTNRIIEDLPFNPFIIHTTHMN